MKITKLGMFLDDKDPKTNTRLMRLRVFTIDEAGKEQIAAWSQQLNESDLVCAGEVALEFAYRHFKRSIFGGQ